MITRSLAGIAVATGILVLAPITVSTAAQAATGASAAQAAAPGQWGPYYAAGKKAKTSGSLTAAPKDDASLPAPYVKVTGSVVSLTRRSSTCGWALFRISYFDSANQPHLAHRNYRSCSYGTTQKFAFDAKNVGEVELKVCTEAKASKPSVNCLYGGTWKPLYTYYQ
ncbi:hypothetical protein [Streptosporangium sp. NPDC087985]|uniref:hypothetical protein n=1 Tax=Streptosporangium sp. NPDC087985 TaxID=3366196 RepID=UPI003829DE11